MRCNSRGQKGKQLYYSSTHRPVYVNPRRFSPTIRSVIEQPPANFQCHTKRFTPGCYSVPLWCLLHELLSAGDEVQRTEPRHHRAHASLGCSCHPSTRLVGKLQVVLLSATQSDQICTGPVDSQKEREAVGRGARCKLKTRTSVMETVHLHASTWGPN